MQETEQAQAEVTPAAEAVPTEKGRQAAAKAAAEKRWTEQTNGARFRPYSHGIQLQSGELIPFPRRVRRLVGELVDACKEAKLTPPHVTTYIIASWFSRGRE